MTKKEQAAFKVVDEVCANYMGNRKEHVTIQTSLQIIYTALNPKDDREKKDEKKKKKNEE